MFTNNCLSYTTCPERYQHCIPPLNKKPITIINKKQVKKGIKIFRKISKPKRMNEWLKEDNAMAI